MADSDARVVSVVILKGGVGKSTTSINLARQLAERGDTLFADLDPNGHATNGLGFGDAYRSDTNIRDVILEGDATPADIIQSTDYGFDLLPSSNTLDDVALDAVFVTLLNRDAFGIIAQALRLDVGVFTEKPAERMAADLEALRGVQDRSADTVCVSYLWTAYPARASPAERVSSNFSATCVGSGCDSSPHN